MTREQRTQRDRVLVALLNAGARGISQSDFLAPNVIDGGEPILRVNSRVSDLRGDGHDIETHGTAAMRRYALRLFGPPSPLRGVGGPAGRNGGAR